MITVNDFPTYSDTDNDTLGRKSIEIKDNLVQKL